MLSHFDFLLGTVPQQESSVNDVRVVDEWASFAQGARGLENEPFPPEDEDWDSVLDAYRHPSSNERPQTVLDKLLSKPNVEPLLESLYSILSQPRHHDVSGEVAEAVGYEDIDAVMEILQNRETLVKQLEEFRHSESGASHSAPDSSSLSAEDARKRMEETFRKNAARPLFSGTAEAAPEILPHVYTSTPMAQGNVLSQFGSKYMLPLGTDRQTYEDFEEVIIPPARPVPPRVAERLILVSELDPLAQGSFPGYKSLNRIQSIVYPTAYGSNENMLVCAPTGAGKTDVAMLSILRVLDQHRSHSSGNASIASTINKSSFKIIYVAPMKALASEIVRKFSKRLQWLSIQVRELTGDMQLTKAEIAQTQVIVTTPEKWDVVTRKPTGEGELAASLKLLIIDEVHLLNEERGAVIETIVARTLRQVESSQSVIRIVGLSATLPNYMDVAEFLSVSRYKGLFYFDSSFRPVPLEQHFIGIKGKPGSLQSRKNLDRVTFQKVSELVAQGHQVMVFVHARKETVKTALALRETSVLEGNVDDFSCEEHPQWSMFRRSIGESRNKEMRQLFDGGFGIHHAGMLRSDRNMMERMFEARAIKVLCCTATLAWGVNLPAHAVIIKGTQVYDSSKGAFVDLSVLDVLQVFGRAGRPGLETSGEGYICTTEDKLTHYLDAITSQNPIESQFQGGMIDSLNAEIALGTVANTHDGVRWLGYTYLFVRMRKNPLIYGISRDATGDDPQLGNKRNELICAAAQKLSDAGMIIFDRLSGDLTITDLGRIAAKYYIRHTSIEIFNKEFRQKMSEADVLVMLSKSTEFDQIQVRDSESKELEQLMEIVPCDVQGPDRSQDQVISSQGKVKSSQGKGISSQDKDIVISSHDKVNILLQGYISRQPVDDFALVSDTAYAAQNGGRIVRALLEIAISRKWANVTAVLMGMSKAIEKRLWPFDQPLKQFNLKGDVFYSLERWADDWSPAELAAVSADELGKLVHLNEHHGQAILDAAKQFPSVRITYNLRPLGFDVLKIAARVTPTFTWNSKVHGSVEPFWLWVEDYDALNILQLSHLVFRPTTEALNVDFVISIPDGQPPPSVTIRFVSDRWMGAEDEISIPLDTLVMPVASHSHSPRLDLPFLSPAILRNSTVESLFAGRLHNFNSIQTQSFWTLINTKWHSLLCGPVGSGKSMLLQVLVWMTAMKASDSWALIVTPRKSVASETLSELRTSSNATGVTIELSFGQNALARPRGRVIRIVTAAHLLQVISQRDPKIPLRGLDLVVCENLEQLDPAYELGVSLLRHAVQTCPTRFVGASSSLSDPVDVGVWLGVDPAALLSFRPSDRDQSLTTSPHTFSIPQSASLFKAMAKPAHAAIQGAALGESAVVFVPSRGQCRSVAYDLITQCALEQETEKGYLPEGVAQDRLEDYLVRLRDASLVDVVSRGIGFFHEGIHKPDRNLMLELYAEGIIRVLIVPRDSCWTLPVRAAVVVVMGTQYAHAEAEGADRQLRDYGLTELVRMQSRAVRHSGAGHFHLFCQAEGKDTFIRFLNDGLPLESGLLDSPELRAWYTAHARLDKQQLVDALSFTFLAHRIATNPTYYDCVSSSRDENLSRIVDDLVYANAHSS
ncbi:Sec63-domain-containing protein [Mycena capillaripes]|nr:Sec63-domain-containing protein [Mycena capillaripes]